MSSDQLVAGAANIGAALLIRFLFPPEGPIDQFGPRLSDLTVTSSAYGSPIKVGAGVVRMGGQIIWSTGLIETTNVEELDGGGGKGGMFGGDSASLTTYSYSASFALAFSAGVAEDVLRMWADGQIIYDKTGAAGTAVDKGDLKFTFYPGNETQLPDPTIEADKGSGNVSAHRGICYLVAENWPLANYGNRIPQLTAEIAYTADENHSIPFDVMTEIASMNPPGSSSGSDDTSHMFLDPFSDNLFFFKSGTNGLSRNTVGDFSAQVQVTTAGLGGSSFRMMLDGFIWGQNGGSNYQDFTQWEPWTLQETGVTFGGTGISGSWGILSGNNPNNRTFMGILPVRNAAWPDEVIYVKVMSANSIHGDGGFTVDWVDFDLEAKDCLPAYTSYVSLDIGRGGFVLQNWFNEKVYVLQESDAELHLWEMKATLRRYKKSDNPEQYCYYTTIPTPRIIGVYDKGGATDPYTSIADTTGWCFLPTEDALILSNGVSMFKVDLAFDVLGGPILAQNGDLGFYSEDQWSNSGRFGFGNGKAGTSDGGFTYVIDTDSLAIIETQDLGDVAFDDTYEANYEKAAWDPRSNTLIFSRQNQTTPTNNERIVRTLPERVSAEGFPTTLDLVVADLCNRAGLDPADYDVTGLAGVDVRGYVVSRPGTVRDALEPLQQGYLFEGVESDWIIKFVLRGGSPVLTIAETDIGRLSTGAKDEFVRETRTQEVELPETFRVLYSDQEKDYQQGIQLDKRVAVPNPSQYARNIISLDLPIVFIGDEAKQLAQRWLYTTWAERLGFNSSLPWRYIRLDPTDVVNATFRGETRRLRMSQIDMGANLDLEFRSTQEDANSNLSDIVADSGQGFTTQTLPSGLPTNLFLLDVPLLNADGASLNQFSTGYWAASGYDDSWSGSELFKSIDGGTQFSQVGSVALESAWGYVIGTIPDAETTNRWDESATIDIMVSRNIALFATSTDTAVLNGANALAVIRGDGLPEIIQFVTVTPLTFNTVRLSRLLRGRRGTEENAIGHSLAERVVLLDINRLATVRTDFSRVGLPLQYRAVSANTFLEDAQPIGFTYTGQDLLPYSVANIQSNRASRFLASTDAITTWLRRTRYGGEMLDFKDTVPINEESEEYDIDYYFAGSVVLQRDGLVEVQTDTVTVAEFTALPHPDGPTARLLLEGEVAFINPSFELGTEGEEPTGWAKSNALNGEGVKQAGGQVGSFYLWMGGNFDDFWDTLQTVDLAATGWDVEQLDINKPTVQFKFWHIQASTAPNEDVARAYLEMLDANGNPLGTIDSGDLTPTEDVWTEETLSGPFIVGTKSLRVNLTGNDVGAGFGNASVGYDDIRVQIGSGVPPLQANIYQESDAIGHGRFTQTSI